MEALVEGFAGLHYRLLSCQHLLQVHSVWRNTVGDGETHQVVRKTVYRDSTDVYPWILCDPGSEALVGAVLLTSLARHHSHPSPESSAWTRGRAEDDSSDSDPVLHAFIRALRQEDVCKTQEEIPNHAGSHEDWIAEAR